MTYNPTHQENEAMMKDWVLVPRADLERITDQERHRRSGGPSPEDLDGLDEGLRVAVQIAADLLSASPHQSAPDVALEIAGFEHPTAGWCNKHYSEVAAHCLRPGPGPVPLVRQSDAAALLSSLASENERLKQERDDLRQSADGYGKLDADFAIAERRLEAAEARLKQAEDALRPFAAYAPALGDRRDDFCEVSWAGMRNGTACFVELYASDFRAAHAFLASQPTTPAYQTFEQWIGEQQGFSIRAEWFDGDMAWLRAAFEAGRASRSSTSQEE